MCSNFPNIWSHSVRHAITKNLLTRTSFLFFSLSQEEGHQESLWFWRPLHYAEGGRVLPPTQLQVFEEEACLPQKMLYVLSLGFCIENKRHFLTSLLFSTGCPKNSSRTRCLKRLGIVIKTRVTYRLRRGHCAKRTTTLRYRMRKRSFLHKVLHCC